MAEIANRTSTQPISRRRFRIPRHILTQNMWALGFLSLALVGLIGLTLIPIVVSFYLSFTDWDVLGPPNIIGAQNFAALTQDATFLRALWNTIYYTGVS